MKLFSNISAQANISAQENKYEMLNNHLIMIFFMVKISPSLFDVAESELEVAVAGVPNADFFHIDITDGRFVRDKNGGASLFFNEKKVERVKTATTIPLDIHLMIAEPGKHVQRYFDLQPGIITFHYEAVEGLKGARSTMRVIKSAGILNPIKAGIALNPDTPVDAIAPLVDDGLVDLVLLMSVVPGLGGQGYISTVTQKVGELRRYIDAKGSDVQIEVDGGIKLDNYHVPVSAGADILVSGSGVFKHLNYRPEEIVRRMKDVLALGSDHAGVIDDPSDPNFPGLKARLKAYCDSQKIAYRDFGCHSEESVDYPDYAHAVGRALESGEYQRGVLICGTGIGITLAATKHPGVRAASIYDPQIARLARKHNDLNVLGLGARFVNDEKALNIFAAWYETEFEGGRHARRVDKIEIER